MSLLFQPSPPLFQPSPPPCANCGTTTVIAPAIEEAQWIFGICLISTKAKRKQFSVFDLGQCSLGS
jgi:hypothetical protein